MDAQYLKDKHEAGLSYADYLATGNQDQQTNWAKVYDSVELTDDQKSLLGGFQRQIRVIGLSGIWCGDCVQQGPLIQKIAEGNPDRIDLRWLDRDEHIDLQQKVRINNGNRVPVCIFMAEDHAFCSWFGDRSLSRYRHLAEKNLGGACPLPGAPVDTDLAAATLQDWLDEFERVHLILRLSTRLREKHGD